MLSDKVLCLLLVLFTSFFMSCIQNWAKTPEIDTLLDKRVTLCFQNEPLGQVIEEISKQSKISILYNQELSSEKVTGDYRNISVSDALNRLFSHKNKSIIFNNDKRMFLVKTFGVQKFTWAATNTTFPSSSADTSNFITAKAKELEENYQKYLSDPESIDPLTGKKLTELCRLKEQMKEEYMKYIEDPSSVDPFTGKKLTRLSLEKKEYGLSVQKYEHDPMATDPLTGRTLQEIALERKELKDMYQRISRQSHSIDPLTGRSWSERLNY